MNYQLTNSLTNAGSPGAPVTQPYVAVGSSPENGVTLSKSTFDILVIIGILLLIGLIVFLAVYFYNRSRSEIAYKPPVIPNSQSNIVGPDSRVGAVRTMRENPLARVRLNEPPSADDCDPHYFGYQCRHHKYDANYWALNNPNDRTPNNFRTTIIDMVSAPYLSFDDNSCTTQCDQTTGCIGVTWEPKNKLNCSLLAEGLVADGPMRQQNLFLRWRPSDNFHNSLITTPKVVYLAANSTALPLRYWDNGLRNSVGFQKLTPGQRVLLTFTPQLVKNDDHLTGYYSRSLFENPTELDRLLSYVHHPDQPLQIPQELIGLNLYVKYL